MVGNLEGLLEVRQSTQTNFRKRIKWDLKSRTLRPEPRPITLDAYLFDRGVGETDGKNKERSERRGGGGGEEEEAREGRRKIMKFLCGKSHVYFVIFFSVLSSW